MKIAFLIAAHQYPELLVRLVKRLDSPAASVFIHIDRDVDIRPFKTLVAQKRVGPVHWVPRVRCRWGTMDQVTASLSLLHEALTMDKDAEMFILLSGQDYPLKPVESMRAFFEQKRRLSFINWAKLPWSIWPDAGGFERLTHYHFMVRGERLEYPSCDIPKKASLRLLYWLCCLFLRAQRNLPADLTFYGGLNWWNLTREAVDFIFAYLEGNPDFFKIFRYTKSADEIFFQTILLNRSDTGLVNDDLRCVFWDGRRNEYPAILRNGEFNEVRNSGKLFARKVHPDLSMDLMDRIDAELLI
jgi:Core-2/I-Branching enzyme